MIENVISLPVLISGAIMDYKYRKVYIMPFIVAAVCGIIINVAIYRRGLENYALGMALSVLLIVICLITKNIMGLGDALAMLMTACIFNSKSMLIIVLLSFLIMSVVGITGTIMKKMKLTTKLPFVPFLLMGEVVFLIIQR